eukprot:scaffold248_cov111-Cylindrotheca_fusiformis.AAC.13
MSMLLKFLSLTRDHLSEVPLLEHPESWHALPTIEKRDDGTTNPGFHSSTKAVGDTETYLKHCPGSFSTMGTLGMSLAFAHRTSRQKRKTSSSAYIVPFVCHTVQCSPRANQKAKTPHNHSLTKMTQLIGTTIKCSAVILLAVSATVRVHDEACPRFKYRHMVYGLLCRSRSKFPVWWCPARVVATLLLSHNTPCRNEIDDVTLPPHTGRHPATRLRCALLVGVNRISLFVSGISIPGSKQVSTNSHDP